MYYNASVPGSTPTKVYTDGRFWAHIARQLQIGAEIRVLAEDMSFRAELLVTYVSGTEVKVTLIHHIQIEKIDYDALNMRTSGYTVSQKGTLGWCVVKVATGELVAEDLPSQRAATNALDDYVRALAN